jgi:hypothetical protein
MFSGSVLFLDIYTDRTSRRQSIPMIAQVNDGDVADGGAGIGADGDMKEEACGVQEVAEDVACIVGAMKGSLKILYCAPSCGGVQKYSRNHPGSSSRRVAGSVPGRIDHGIVVIGGISNTKFGSDTAENLSVELVEGRIESREGYGPRELLI